VHIRTTAVADSRLVWGIAGLCLAGFAVVILHRCLTPIPASEYVHRLVTYDNGLIRRALVGEIYSWFLSAVPQWVIRIEAFAFVAAALGLFAMVFRRLFPGRGADTLLIACFLIGSPLLFKNFIGNLGKFDTWGAVVAMLAVLLPLRASTFGIVWALCVALLFAHHLHATIYIPTIYAILLVRMVGARGGFDAGDLGALAASIGLLACVFLGLLVFGVPSLEADAFLDAMRERSLRSFPDHHANMWYSTVAQEMAGSFAVLPEHVLRLPLYAAFVLIHLPIIFFFWRRLAPLATTYRASHEAFVLGAIVVAGGFLATNIVTFDYARHLGNMALCFVLLAAAQILSTTGPIEDAGDIQPESRLTLIAATTVAIIPWTGTIFPLF
jgi:hypothetical protein